MRSIHRFMAVLLIALAGCTWATGITFTFGNIRVTGSAPKVIEFDVLAQASENGTFLGDTQVYINYNTLGFGEYIAANSKVTVIKGVLLQGEVPIVGPKYELINTLDNTIDRFSVAANYRFDGSLEGANPLTTAPQSLFSVAIEILDPLQTAGLSFAEDLMVGQQYQYDNTAKYDPVNADDQDDSSLPVQLNSFSATRQAHGIELVWTTESEIDNLGFNLFRSDSDSGPWIQINGALIPGAGRSSEPIDYIFFDNRVENDRIYCYQLEDLSATGLRQVHGPVAVDAGTFIPADYLLEQNYPNPFNPQTTLSYGLPEQSRVILDIFNLRGERVARLIDAEQTAGMHTVLWKAENDSGTPVSSGVYFYSLRANKYHAVGKMVLTR